MGYNPCYCWDLKDGCITIGIWSSLWSILNIGVFGWQTWVIKWKWDLDSNRPGRLSSPYSFHNSRPDWTQFYVSPEENKFLGIFSIQIVNLISAIFLFFASCSLIYGIHTNSKHLVWPWFPCIAVSTVGSTIYCILWWAGNVESYWLILTLVEFATVIVNVYCILCVVVQYKKILKGYVRQGDSQHKPNKILYEYRASRERLNAPDFDEYKKKIPDEIIVKDGRIQVTEPDQLIPTLNDLQRLYTARQSARHKKFTGNGAPNHAVVAQNGPASEFKAKFTEAWINQVNNSPENANLCDQSKFDAEKARLYSRRTKSADGLQQINDNSDLRSCKSKESVASTRSHRRCRHRSHPCRHKCRRDCNNDDNYDDGASNSSDETSGRCAARRGHARSCSSYRSTKSSRSRCSDSDTGCYSASSVVASETDMDMVEQAKRSKKKRKCKRTCCKHQTIAAEAAADGYDGDGSHGRRPRAVKRYDRSRQMDGKEGTSMAAVNVPTDGGGIGMQGARLRPFHAPVGGISVLPPHPGMNNLVPPRTISIPQHIIIPAGLERSTDSDQPQKYQINSEIRITCDGDKEFQQGPYGPREPPFYSTINDVARTVNSTAVKNHGSSTNPWAPYEGPTPYARNAAMSRSSPASGGSSDAKKFASTAV